MKANSSAGIKWEPWLACVLLILAGLLTYVILIPWLGFYRDDWYMLWAGQSRDGLGAIIRLFQTDRPLIGWTYALIFKFFGTSVLLWQLLGLLLKISTGLAVFWLGRSVWPGKRIETTMAALLFELYPGFLQQPVAATFCIDLLGLNAIFISIALTVYALKTSNRIAQIIAVLFSILLGLINLSLYEATIGLEVVRWALVWIVLQQKKGVAPANMPASEKTSFAKKFSLHVDRASLIQLSKQLAPYIVMLAGYLYWRVFLFKSVRRATNINVLLSDYASNPFLSFVQVVIGYIKDLFETIILAWFVPFYQFTAEGRFNSFMAGLGISLLVVALTLAYMIWYRRHFPDQDNPRTDLNSFLWIGLIGVVIPQAVINILGRNVLFANQWDRYTTQSMLGVAILLSALIFKYLRGHARWTFLTLLIFLAVMTQFHSAAYYSRFWDYERGTIWQLSWRAPGLQPDTTLIVSLPEGSRLAEEYEIWGPVNIAFYPGQPMQVTGQVPTDDLILSLQSKTLDKRTTRNINVRRDYGKPLLLSIPSANSCLHVLDGNHPALPFYENPQIKETVSYSNIHLIDLTAAPVTPQVSIFGSEPEHNWCYYYQKIELNLQENHFAEAAKLVDEASGKGLKPSDETEWLVEVVAYLNANQVEKAGAAAREIDKDVRKYMCLQTAQWKPASTAAAGTGYDHPLLHGMLCTSN